MRELFKGKKVMLAAPREGDNEISADWHEDSAFLRCVDTDTAYPRSAEALAAYARRTPTSFPFTIRLLKGDAAIGFAAVHSVEWGNQSGVLSIALGEAAHRGKGHAAEALALLLRFAFLELNLHRVGLEVIAYNESALRLYHAAGFTEEGRARQRVFRDGARWDLVAMGLLRPEWEALQNQNGGGEQ